MYPAAAAAAAKSLQSCPTLCDPIVGSPPGSSVPGILQARTLEWVAISFSNARKWKVKVKSLSRVRPSVTPWTAAHQAPPSMGVSKQEYWSGVPLPSPGSSKFYRVSVCMLVVQSRPTEKLVRLLCLWDSPGRNTEVGGHSLLQRIFPTQESNPDLLHCRQIVYHLSHQGSPLTLSVMLKINTLIKHTLRNIQWRHTLLSKFSFIFLVLDLRLEPVAGIWLSPAWLWTTRAGSKQKSAWIQPRWRACHSPGCRG